MNRKVVSKSLILIVAFGTFNSCGSKISRHLDKAEEYETTYKYELALKEYEAAAEESPGSFGAHLGLIGAAASLDSCDLGIRLREIKRTYENRVFEVPGLNNFALGLILSHQGLTYKADKHFVNANKENADEPWIKYYRAVNLIKRNKPESAIEIFKGIIADHPGFHDAYPALIGTYTEEKEYRKAINFIENEEAPKLPKHLRLKHTFVSALTYYKSGNRAKAKEMIENAKKRDARTSADFYRVFLFYLLTEQKDKAQEIGEYIIKKYPKEPIGYYALGQTYFLKKEYSESVINYKKAGELGSDFIVYRLDMNTPLKERGHKHYQESEYSKAIKCYEDAIDQCPEDYRTRCALGDSYYYAGDFEGAVREFEYIIDNAANPAIGYSSLGRLYQEMGQYELEIDARKKVLDLEPGDLYNYGFLADALEYEKRFNESERVLLRGLEIDPEYAISYYRLGKLFLSEENPKKDIDKAINDLKEGLRVCNNAKPEDLATIHFLLSAAYYYKGSERNKQTESAYGFKELAIPEIKKAIELDRSNQSYIDFLDALTSNGSKATTHSRIVIMDKEGCELRSAPSLDGDFVEMVPYNTECKVLDRHKGWFKIETPSGRIGWLSGYGEVTGNVYVREVY